MSKILLISCTPRHDSNTKKLVQTFIDATRDKADITHLDLVDDPAPLLLGDNLNALLKRNFMGLELDANESKILQDVDQLVDQLQDFERIVLAYPMYNFCVPAVVKAWFDAVIQNGKTFKMKAEGGYEGLCQDTKALVLMTTGGDYSQEPTKSMNFATPLAQTCFGFMGIKAHSINAYGLNQYMDNADKIVATACQEIVAYLANSDFI
ncbi:MAG: NAD(P)H-dependent oxidoreductase [Devosiaceae bacterium]|nr:NAD(P)H-dependent oxidoreductase [Devosiaceae bacterium]